jgi:putative membrane protein
MPGRARRAHPAAVADSDLNGELPASKSPDQGLPAPIKGDPTVELSSNRTSLALARTQMSADQTLMSTLRTSLSLISFGFTIDQAFHQIHRSGVARIGEAPARNFGLALILLGLAMLVMGVIGHARFSRSLTARRARLYSMDLLHTDVRYRATPTLISAVLLLALGIAAAVGILIRSRLGG